MTNRCRSCGFEIEGDGSTHNDLCPLQPTLFPTPPDAPYQKSIGELQDEVEELREYVEWLVGRVNVLSIRLKQVDSKAENQESVILYLRAKVGEAP